MAKLEVTVLGIDSAAVNSGLCIGKTTSPTKGPPQFEVAFESGIVHGPLNDHTARIKAAALIKGLCVEHKVDFVVMEGYALRMGSTNSSGYQHGETCGLIKNSLYELRMPFMICPPTSMRSFLNVPSKQKDSGKSYIIETMKDEYGFSSSMTNKSKISNATDAAVHSVIGGLIYLHFHDRELGEMSKPKTDVLFGGRGKMLGLVNMKELFFDCYWAKFDEQ